MKYLLLIMSLTFVSCGTEPETPEENEECETEVIHYPCPSGDCVTCLDD